MATHGPSIGDRAYRLGAIALATGASALWAGAAQATLITQVYDLPLNASTKNVKIGGGAPAGSAQYGLSDSSITLHSTAAVAGFLGKVSELSPGSVVGGSTLFLTGNGSSFDYTPGSDTTYLGLRFDISPSLTPYGYATIANNELISVTYDTSGSPVTVVQASEPPPLSLLALGALGVVSLRRRRSADA